MSTIVGQIIALFFALLVLVAVGYYLFSPKMRDVRKKQQKNRAQAKKRAADRAANAWSAREGATSQNESS